MAPIFYIKDGSLSFADQIVLEPFEIYISAGDKICLIGRNGSGKSSLMKLITGEYELDIGQKFVDTAINISYLQQDLKSIPDLSIDDFVMEALDPEIMQAYQAENILKQLFINGKMRLRNCSGGQIRRACLAKSLITQPEILLLDEPTNHLDITSIEWLENYIKNYPGAVISVSHDRYFQEKISNKVWWIDRGMLRKSNQGFKHYEQWREEIIAHEEATLRKMNRKLEVEENWMYGGGVTARRKRNQKRLASLRNLRENLKIHNNKLTSAKVKLKIRLDDEAKKSKFIIEAENLAHHFGEKKLFDKFNLKIKKGEKIGVIGANGSGKSTLIKILTGDMQPAQGKIKYGANIDITYLDQHRLELNPEYSIKKTLCPNGGDQIFLQGRYLHVAAYLKKFMFDPKNLEDKVSCLSGGQANRLLLAKSLINMGNFFVLDEPTNDLDLDSLEILLEILADYQGTLIIVSHDRDFLERLVTRTLIFTGSEIIDLYGGYKDYLAYQKTTKQEVNKGAVLNQARANSDANKNSITVKNTSKKLSYKYLRLAELLPKEIEQLEALINKLETILADPVLYQTNQEKFKLCLDRLEQAKSALDKKMQEWLKIETMQENYKD